MKSLVKKTALVTGASRGIGKAFLASTDAGWVTGQWIEVSGGLGI